ncbi:xanthine dehydrogenase family protein subunit M [Neobacillus niacini]|uniref:FAD binding domain-containing protein n=1 Tax=Neobacillus niacini TaxID=86668 RepID=UPI0030027495
MKPAPFNYLRPETIEEALSYLSKYGEDAKVLSGGQSLIPLLNMRLSTPEYLIDIGGVKGLNYINLENETLSIGALTRHVDVERSSLIREKCPLLYEAIRFVGHGQIRNRGTIGGSIAHADPSAELPCVLSALRGNIVIANSDEERVVSPEEFFLTYLLTTIEPNEIIKEVQFPVLSPTCGSAFVEISRTHGDFAMVEVAAVLDLDENGRISFARLAVGGASSVPCVLEEVEEFLIGHSPSEGIFKQASEKVKDFIDPEGDLHASEDHRRQLSSVLTFRALNIAAKRAKRGGTGFEE